MATKRNTNFGGVAVGTSNTHEYEIPYPEKIPFSSRMGKKGFLCSESMDGRREDFPFSVRFKPLYIFSIFFCRGHAYAPLQKKMEKMVSLRPLRAAGGIFTWRVRFSGLLKC